MSTCKKVSFSDEKQANFYIDKLNKTSVRIDKPVRAYLCHHCMCWHLTSRTKVELDLCAAYREEIKKKNEIITKLTRRIHELKNLWP